MCECVFLCWLSFRSFIHSLKIFTWQISLLRQQYTKLHTIIRTCTLLCFRLFFYSFDLMRTYILIPVTIQRYFHHCTEIYNKCMARFCSIWSVLNFWDSRRIYGWMNVGSFANGRLHCLTMYNNVESIFPFCDFTNTYYAAAGIIFCACVYFAFRIYFLFIFPIESVFRLFFSHFFVVVVARFSSLYLILYLIAVMHFNRHTFKYN